MKRIRFLPIAAVFLICTANLYATAQYPDKIIYEGNEYMLHSNPLEAYFVKNPDKKPKGGIMSSALWRGYVATFEIADNSLYLKDINVEVSTESADDSFETEWKSVLSTVVPGDKRLKIGWLTGLLVIPHGEIVKYVHMGYGSTYENYILLELAKGDLKRTKKFDFKEYENFKQRQFEEFEKTDEYKTLVKDLKKDKNYSEDFIESFLKNFVIDYTSTILVD